MNCIEANPILPVSSLNSKCSANTKKKKKKNRDGLRWR